MTEQQADDVLVFQSVSFPAADAGDPEKPTEAMGTTCLQHILEGVVGGSLSVWVEPLTEGSGATAVVESFGSHVNIHLTWFPMGKSGGETRDIWTLQFWLNESLLRKLFGRSRGQEDPGFRATVDAVCDFLRGHGEEFTEVHWCNWADLESGS